MEIERDMLGEKEGLGGRDRETGRKRQKQRQKQRQRQRQRQRQGQRQRQRALYLNASYAYRRGRQSKAENNVQQGLGQFSDRDEK